MVLTGWSGSYYVVTDGLAHKYGHRVLDWPPDETSLVGAAMGFSQVAAPARGVLRRAGAERGWS